MTIITAPRCTKCGTPLGNGFDRLNGMEDQLCKDCKRVEE